MKKLKMIKNLFSSTGKKQLQQEQKENWGVYEKSNSGIEWFLGRRMDWHGPNYPDSKEFLEELGFRILGISDQMRYCVEPPKGFTMKKMSEHHFNIYNENNEYQFRVFEKMDFNDFRCFLCKK